MKVGEALVVLEAMKMEHTMHAAPRGARRAARSPFPHARPPPVSLRYAAADATVKGVHASEGAVVPQREMLVSFE